MDTQLDPIRRGFVISASKLNKLWVSSLAYKPPRRLTDRNRQYFVCARDVLDIRGLRTSLAAPPFNREWISKPESLADRDSASLGCESLGDSGKTGRIYEMHTYRPFETLIQPKAVNMAHCYQQQENRQQIPAFIANPGLPGSIVTVAALCADSLGQSVKQNEVEGRITLLVGPEKRRFRLHESLLCAESRYFTNSIKWDRERRDSNEIVLELQDEEPLHFGMMVRWLYTRCLPIHGEILDDLIGLYVLADKLFMPRLEYETTLALFDSTTRFAGCVEFECEQNLDELKEKQNGNEWVAREGDCLVCERCVPWVNMEQVIDRLVYVYSNTPEGSALRKWLCHSLNFHFRKEDIQMLQQNVDPELLAEFLSDYLCFPREQFKNDMGAEVFKWLREDVKACLSTPEVELPAPLLLLDEDVPRGVANWVFPFLDKAMFEYGQLVEPSEFVRDSRVQQNVNCNLLILVPTNGSRNIRQRKIAIGSHTHLEMHTEDYIEQYGSNLVYVSPHGIESLFPSFQSNGR